MKNFIDWAIEKHRDTNHFYDKYLPYEFHLRMVVQVFHDFKHLLPKNLYKDYGRFDEEYDITENVIQVACWGHDLIEDCRVSWNDCKTNLNPTNWNASYVADIIYAVTNEKGKTRHERANDKYYEGIRDVPGAVFVKLCDRIANVQYSKMTKSGMFEKYKSENPNFIEKLGCDTDNPFAPMFNYLINLFKE